MANLKISELTQRTPDGTEYLEVIIPPFTSGTNRKVLLQDAIDLASGGTGVVESIVAGTNITVDDTDPANPIISASGGGGSGTVTSVSGTTNRVTVATGTTTPVIDISAAYDALWAAAITAALAPYVLNSATPSTAGGTITLDMNSQAQRMFVGSASFGTAKAIALSNTTNSLVLNLVLTLTNVAAVLTFPSSFTMASADSRWNNGAFTFTPQTTGKYEFSATWDGTDWNLKVAGPYS
jgi:hypothetical protein